LVVVEQLVFQEVIQLFQQLHQQEVVLVDKVEVEDLLLLQELEDQVEDQVVKPLLVGQRVILHQLVLLKETQVVVE
tara:strand:- start:218 stop:445 length:228 start_codon:yes stop_codon:yes gene_type:complete